MNSMEEFKVIIELIDAGDLIESKGSEEEINEWRRVVKNAKNFLKKSDVDIDIFRKVIRESNGGKEKKKKAREEKKVAKKGSLESFGL